MDKFVIRGPQGVLRRDTGPKQRKLENLKQVVTLDAGMTSVVFTEADLARQVSVLQHAGSTAEQLVCALRTLSCLVLGAPQFVAMPMLQLSVEALQCHTDRNVQRIAINLADKWTSIVSAPPKLAPPGSLARLFSLSSGLAASDRDPSSGQVSATAVSHVAEGSEQVQPHTRVVAGASGLTLGRSAHSSNRSAGCEEMRCTSGRGLSAHTNNDAWSNQCSVIDLCTPPETLQSPPKPRRSYSAELPSSPSAATAAAAGDHLSDASLAVASSVAAGASAAAARRGCYYSGPPHDVPASQISRQHGNNGTSHPPPACLATASDSSTLTESHRQQAQTAKRWAAVNTAAHNHQLPQGHEPDRSRKQWGTLAFRPTRCL